MNKQFLSLIYTDKEARDAFASLKRRCLHIAELCDAVARDPEDLHVLFLLSDCIEAAEVDGRRCQSIIASHRTPVPEHMKVKKS